MISVGDTLLKLGVDTRDLDKGMKGLGAKIKQHQKAIGIGMVAMGGAILAGGALAVKTFAQMGDEVHKMSLRTGFATETLSRLKYAAEIGGATLGDVEKAVKKMSKTIADAGYGLETYVRVFREIGIEVEELDGLNPEEQFMKIAEAVAKVEDPSKRAAIAQDVFGRAGTKLLPMLSEGTEGLKLMMAEAEKFAPIFDTEAAAAAAKLTDTMGQLTGSMTKVKLAIAERLIPVLTPLLEKLRDTISQISAWIKEHPTLTKVIVLGTTALGGLLVALGGLILIMPGLTAALGAFGITLHLALGPIALVTLGIAALVAAGIALWRNWDWVGLQLKKLWANMQIAFGHTVKFIVNTVLQPFLLYIGEFLGNIVRGVGKVVSIFNKEWGAAIENVADEMRNLGGTITDWANNLVESGERSKRVLAAIEEGSEAMIATFLDPYEQAGFAVEDLEEKVRELGDEYEAYIASIEALVEAEEFAQTEAGKLGLTMDDLKQYMIAAGYEAEMLALSYEEWLELGEDVNRFAERFQINLEDIARTSEMTTDDMLRDIKELTSKAKDAARETTRVQIEAINDRMKAERNAHRDRMDQLRDEYDQTIKTIDAGLDAALQGYQSQLDAIDRQIEGIDDAERGRRDAERKAELEASLAEEDDADRRIDLEDRLNELLIKSDNVEWQKERELAYKARIAQEKDADERRRLERNLADFLLEVQAKRTRKQLETDRDTLRQEMDMAREAARNEKDRAQEAYDYKRDLQEQEHENLISRLENEKEALDQALEETLQRYDDDLEAFMALLEDETKEMADFVAAYNELIDQLKDKTVTITTAHKTVGAPAGAPGAAPPPPGAPGRIIPVGEAHPGMPGWQGGGIAMRPIVRRIAEGGPEAVLPLDRATLERLGLGGGGYRTANLYFMVDGRVLAEALEEPLVDDIYLRTGVRR